MEQKAQREALVSFAMPDCIHAHSHFQFSLWNIVPWLLLRKSDAAKEISPLEMELYVNLTTFLT